MPTSNSSPSAYEFFCNLRVGARVIRNALRSDPNYEEHATSIDYYEFLEEQVRDASNVGTGNTGTVVYIQKDTGYVAIDWDNATLRDDGYYESFINPEDGADRVAENCWSVPFWCLSPEVQLTPEEKEKQRIGSILSKIKQLNTKWEQRKHGITRDLPA